MRSLHALIKDVSAEGGLVNLKPYPSIPFYEANPVLR
jgi:hypothetical protein